MNNDVDRLFGQGLDISARKRILTSIKELMEESDWHSFNREIVEK